MPRWHLVNFAQRISVRQRQRSSQLCVDISSLSPVVHRDILPLRNTHTSYLVELPRRQIQGSTPPTIFELSIRLALASNRLSHAETSLRTELIPGAWVL